MFMGICCYGYCWMLDDYVARELPNKVQLVEISQWSRKRMNNKVDK